MRVAKLHEAIAAVCPIQGVSVGNAADKGTWRIDFDPAATQQQKTAAQAALAAFSAAADEADEQAAKDRVVALEAASRSDTIVNNLRSMTFQQAEDYVNAGVTDLASARAFMVKLAQAIVYLMRNQ